MFKRKQKGIGFLKANEWGNRFSCYPMGKKIRIYFLFTLLQSDEIIVLPVNVFVVSHRLKAGQLLTIRHSWIIRRRWWMV